MAFLELREVHKDFGTIAVLRGVNLDVSEHQVVCLIGPSGCGKSTLLRCINGLEKIRGGEIRLDDDRVSGPGVDLDRLRQQVGIVFQSFNLFPHMRVLENVTLAPIKVLRIERDVAEEKAIGLLKRIGLEAKALEYPDRLSGGQQQRVAIVRALAMEPKLLLLDEVTSALDPELVAEVLNIVRDLAAQGMTMLLATHEMGFAREVASKICFLYDGVVHEEGPPEQLFKDPRTETHPGLPQADHRSGTAVNRSQLIVADLWNPARNLRIVHYSCPQFRRKLGEYRAIEWGLRKEDFRPGGHWRRLT